MPTFWLMSISSAGMFNDLLNAFFRKSMAYTVTASSPSAAGNAALSLLESPFSIVAVTWCSSFSPKSRAMLSTAALNAGESYDASTFEAARSAASPSITFKNIPVISMQIFPSSSDSARSYFANFLSWFNSLLNCEWRYITLFELLYTLHDSIDNGTKSLFSLLFVSSNVKTIAAWTAESTMAGWRIYSAKVLSSWVGNSARAMISFWLNWTVVVALNPSPYWNPAWFKIS